MRIKIFFQYNIFYICSLISLLLNQTHASDRQAQSDLDLIMNDSPQYPTQNPNFSQANQPNINASNGLNSGNLSNLTNTNRPANWPAPTSISLSPNNFQNEPVSNTPVLQNNMDPLMPEPAPIIAPGHPIQMQSQNQLNPINNQQLPAQSEQPGNCEEKIENVLTRLLSDPQFQALRNQNENSNNLVAQGFNNPGLSNNQSQVGINHNAPTVIPVPGGVLVETYVFVPNNY